MLKIENNDIECNNISAVNVTASNNVSAPNVDVGGQLSVAGCGLLNGIKGVSTNGDWTTLLSAEVPAGLSQNLLIQAVAREVSTGHSAAFTYNGMVVSDPEALVLVPDDIMDALSLRVNKGDSASWAIRALIATELTPGSNTHNIQLQVKGEQDKIIKWAIMNSIAMALPE